MFEESRPEQSSGVESKRRRCALYKGIEVEFVSGWWCSGFQWPCCCWARDSYGSLELYIFVKG